MEQIILITVTAGDCGFCKNIFEPNVKPLLDIYSNKQPLLKYISIKIPYMRMFKEYMEKYIDPITNSKIRKDFLSFIQFYPIIILTTYERWLNLNEPLVINVYGAKVEKDGKIIYNPGTKMDSNIIISWIENNIKQIMQNKKIIYVDSQGNKKLIKNDFK